MSKQESLRRTINRRARVRHLNNDEQDIHKRSASASSNEAITPPLDELDFLKNPEIPQTRRDSDARSIKTTNLPISSHDILMRKSAAATTSTASPGTATPVPHFASQRNKQATNRRAHLPVDNRGSAASANLLQNLQRSESSNISVEGNGRQPSSRWGSIFSGFFGNRESTGIDNGETPVAPDIVNKKSTSVEDPANGSENEPASATMGIESEQRTETQSSGNISIPAGTGSHPERLNYGHSFEAKPNDEQQSSNSPVKLSVGSEDGVIDVEVPLPGFVSLSSSGDSTASPKKTRTSVTSLEGVNSFPSNSGSYNSGSKDYDGVKINVAGWLKRYHGDFLLQAVHPYNTLEADIKRSMTAEATPSQNCSTPFADPESSNWEKWVDVCTTLIADTRTFTLKRLRLRRKVSPKFSRTTVPSPTNSCPVSPHDLTGTSAPSQFSGFFSAVANKAHNGGEAEIEEAFIEEPVMDLDGTLVDAVERVLACSGQSSMAHSRATSPSRTRKSRRSPSHGDKQAASANAEFIPSSEVPRGECKKMVLGALEEVVRSVTAERYQEEIRAGLGVNAMVSVGRGRSGTPVADNTLREGIRRWLLDVEEAC